MLEHRRRDGCAARDDGRSHPDGDRLDGERRGGAGAAREQAPENFEPAGAGEPRVRLAQPVAQRATGTKEERLDGRGRDGERRRELVVREPAELAQQQRLALRHRQRVDRMPERDEIGAVDRL